MPVHVTINTRQLMVLTALITVGDSLLVLPAIPIIEAKQDAWISAILGLVVGLLVICLIVRAGKLNHHLTLVELNEHTFGRWVGVTASLSFLAYLLISVSAHIREIGDFSITEIMPDTPIEAIHILVLLPIIIGARYGLEVFGRAAEIFFPLFLILFLILTFSLLPKIDMNNIRPFFEGGLKPILRGSITFVAFPFVELIVFMMILPSVNHVEKIRRKMVTGALIGGVILVLTVVLSVLILGAIPAAGDTYPSYELAKTVSIGKFFERIEAMMALSWVVTDYFKTTLFFYAFNVGLAQVLKINDYRTLTLPVGMILIVLTLLISPNVAYYNYFVSNFWPYMDFVFGIFLPLLLLAGYAIRRKVQA